MECAHLQVGELYGGQKAPCLLYYTQVRGSGIVGRFPMERVRRHG